MSARSKQFIQLIDSATGELIVSADLTPATVKRLVKEYARFGYILAMA
jgi:ribosomal protein L30E